MQQEFLACILASSTAVRFAEVSNQRTYLLHSIPTKNTATVSMHFLLEKHGAAGSYRNSTQSQKWISSFCHPESITQLCPQQPSWTAEYLCLTSVSVRKVPKKMLNVSAGTAEFLLEIPSEW